MLLLFQLIEAKLSMKKIVINQLFWIGLVQNKNILHH